MSEVKIPLTSTFFGSLHHQILPTKFFIKFEKKQPPTTTLFNEKEEPLELNWETQFQLKDSKILMFTTKNSYIYKLELTQGKILTGDLRVKIYNVFEQIYMFKNENNFDLKTLDFEIDTIKDFKYLLKEEKDKNLKKIFKDLGIEEYLDGFKKQKVNVKSLLLFNEERLEKYIKEEGPRLLLLDYINKNK